MQTRRLAAVAAVVASGCSVPSVTFYSDASIDGNEDAVVDAGGDGDASNDTTALVDASDAGSEADSPACPIAPPPGATACCGAVACAGDCPDACAACVSKCTATQQCCVRAQSVTCHAPGTSCP